MNFNIDEFAIKGEDLSVFMRDALIAGGYIPPLGHEMRKTHSWFFRVEMGTNRNGGESSLIITREKLKTPPPPVEPYKAGDWKDPELEDIYNESES